MQIKLNLKNFVIFLVIIFILQDTACKKSHAPAMPPHDSDTATLQGVSPTGAECAVN